MTLFQPKDPDFEARVCDSFGGFDRHRVVRNANPAQSEAPGIDQATAFSIFPTAVIAVIEVFASLVWAALRLAVTAGLLGGVTARQWVAVSLNYDCGHMRKLQ